MAWVGLRLGAVAVALAAACQRVGAGAVPDGRSLYQEFEALNTVENLAYRYLGGELPDFIKHQTELLGQMAALPPSEAVPILLRVASEHLERVEALSAAQHRMSPLVALQVPLADALALHAGSPEVRRTMAQFAKSPRVKEFARGRALDALVGHQLGQIEAKDDPTGRSRARALLATLIDQLTVSEVLRAPGRLRAVSRRAAAIARDGPETFWRALDAAAETPAQSYAAATALATACAEKDAAGAALTKDERELLLAACEAWLKQFRPVAAKEDHPSDLLGHVLMRLAIRDRDGVLARLLREHGVIPAP